MRIRFLFLLIFCSALLRGQNNASGQTAFFDFKKADARIRIIPEEKLVKGKVNFEFEVLQQQNKLHIDGRKMQFSDVLLNGSPVKFSVEDDGINISHNFLPSEANKLSLEYSVQPESGMYFINWEFPELPDSEKQVWTQGQGKYTSTWLPSFDEMTEKLEFDLSFEFPSGFELISNGELQEKQVTSDSTWLWQYDMKQPMSSYLLAVAAGKFGEKEIFSSTGDRIELFYRPEDSSLVEPTYRYTQTIFDFLENEIGEPYPWQNYKQVPVMDFLYAGMENTGATIFSSSLMTDSIGFKDRNYVNVNAHELAHQWFGNLVTETRSKHHWLHEGFATYYALLAEKEIFGEDYYYWKLYETAEKLKELSDKGKGEALLNPKASSLTFYQKGAWALHILREKVGDDAFKKGIQTYLDLYAYKNVETDNFIAEMEIASGMDLSQFVRDWLEQSAFKSYRALASLKRSEFLKNYLDIAALSGTPLDQKYDILNRSLDFPVNDYIGQEVVHQLAGMESQKALEFYKKAFSTNNIFVRQAIALSMQEIPSSLKSNFESLLQDDSYLTREVALFKLWQQFPEERSGYLEKTKGMTGFYEKNIRMLWLTLNLVTPEYEGEKAGEYYKELASYTEEWRPFQVRENAFGYLYQIGSFNRESLESLVKGTQHHTYSFRNYCRQLMNELLKSEQYEKDLSELTEVMAPEDTVYLRSKIN